ncbi:MAG: hypothetical protein ACI8V0_001381 [Pseudohongiellaceae bacterium]
MPRFLKLILVKVATLSLVLISLGAAPNRVLADANADAAKLIELTNISEQFELARQQQTLKVIRTYASIVSHESGHELPVAVQEKIAQCYEQEYDWSNFEDGIIDILLGNFSEKELGILLDFYRNRGLAPTEIDAFKNIVAKGELIQKLGAEYIFTMTNGCVTQGTEAVLKYLREQP